MFPPLYFDADSAWAIPGEEQCAQLWNKYGMMPHIRSHCRAVAGIAAEIVRRAEERSCIPAGRLLNVPLARAAALLHDLAKTYTILHGGSHAQLGAAWVREETGNPALAQAVLFHASWPWNDGALDDVRDPLRLPIIVAYADKRVRHDEKVTLEERFADLMARYGVNREKRALLCSYLARTKKLERALADKVGEL